jgi:hypothetical protein
MWSKIRFKITPPELNLFSNFLKLTKILHILIYDYEPTNFIAFNYIFQAGANLPIGFGDTINMYIS